MQTCAGLQQPAGGRIRVHGKDVTGWSYHRMQAEDVAYMPAGRLEAGLGGRTFAHRTRGAGAAGTRIPGRLADRTGGNSSPYRTLPDRGRSAYHGGCTLRRQPAALAVRVVEEPLETNLDWSIQPAGWTSGRRTGSGRRCTGAGKRARLSSLCRPISMRSSSAATGSPCSQAERCHASWRPRTLRWKSSVT